MDGHLLLVILLYSVPEIKAQVLRPPILMVNPSMITETDSVTLNCQNPPSMSECYFRFARGQPAKGFSCLKKLTGTELLELAHTNSPAEVKVTCLYLAVSASPESEASSISVRTFLPPTLTVNPPVIKQTDSVTLNCRPPSFVSVPQCYFYTLISGGTVGDSSCVQTLTGSELLKRSPQSSPVEVKVICFYIGNLGSSSPHSETSSIIIHSQTPQISREHFHGSHVLFTCSLPESADHGTRCNLYFGDANHPVQTKTTGRKRPSETKQCQFEVQIHDLLRRRHSFEQNVASCDYSLGSDSLSPRSDGLSFADIVERESRTTRTMPTFSTTTGLTASRPPAFPPLTPTMQTPETATSVTPMYPDAEVTAGVWMWKFVVVVAGCGITVGVILLVSAIARAGSKEVKKLKPTNEDYDAYHLYSIISEAQVASAGLEYSTVQAH